MIKIYRGSCLPEVDGKTDKTVTQSATNTKRDESRIALSTLYLLRERLGQPCSPEGLDNPQPLTELEVRSFLNDVIEKHIYRKDDRGYPWRKDV